MQFGGAGLIVVGWRREGAGGGRSLYMGGRSVCKAKICPELPRR
jgi:hypothetical protein